MLNLSKIWPSHSPTQKQVTFLSLTPIAVQNMGLVHENLGKTVILLKVFIANTIYFIKKILIAREPEN